MGGAASSLRLGGLCFGGETLPPLLSCLRLEERDDGRVAVFLRDGQWRVSIPRRPIDLGTLVQQQPRRVDVAVPAGNVQRRLAFVQSL